MFSIASREKRTMDLASLRLSRQTSQEGSHSSEEDLSVAAASPAESWRRRRSSQATRATHRRDLTLSNAKKDAEDALVWLWFLVFTETGCNFFCLLFFFHFCPCFFVTVFSCTETDFSFQKFYRPAGALLSLGLFFHKKHAAIFFLFGEWEYLPSDCKLWSGGPANASLWSGGPANASLWSGGPANASLWSGGPANASGPATRSFCLSKKITSGSWSVTIGAMLEKQENSTLFQFRFVWSAVFSKSYRDPGSPAAAATVA